MNIQENIKKYRTLKGWTQEDLATYLNVTRQTISKWEQGINEPDISTLERLSELFEISVDELLGKENSNKTINFYNTDKICNILSIVLSCLCCMILLIFLRYMYNKIPMHYTWTGEIDRYGSKWEWLFMLIYFLTILFVDLICCKSIYKSVNSKKNRIAFWITKACCWSCQIAGVGMFLGFTLSYLRKDTWYPILNCLIYSTLFCLFVFMHPKITKRNSVFGFRTQFTIANEVAWNKINKFSCYTLSINCILAILVQLFVNSFWMNLTISFSLYLGGILCWGYYFHIKNKLE